MFKICKNEQPMFIFGMPQWIIISTVVTILLFLFVAVVAVTITMTYEQYANKIIYIHYIMAQF